MPDWSIDSSVVAKWVLPEVDTPLAQRAGADIRAGGGRLVIVDFARIETANAIRTQFHRSLIDAATATTLFGALQSLGTRDEPATQLLPAAFDLALRYGLAVYDALFVALVLDQGSSGLTADEALWRAVHSDLPQIHLLRDWPPP
jgi:predicted nucleic acid-binding protein